MQLNRKSGIWKARITDAQNPKEEETKWRERKEKREEKKRVRAEEKMRNSFIVIKFYGTPTSHLH